MFKIDRNYLLRRMFSTLTPSLFPFSIISPLCISRVARYTPFSQRQADEKNETNLVSINSEHLLKKNSMRSSVKYKITEITLSSLIYCLYKVRDATISCASDKNGSRLRCLLGVAHRTSLTNHGDFHLTWISHLILNTGSDIVRKVVYFLVVNLISTYNDT